MDSLVLFPDCQAAPAFCCGCNDDIFDVDNVCDDVDDRGDDVDGRVDDDAYDDDAYDDDAYDDDAYDDDACNRCKR
jgi:hypothetical protein